MMFDVYTVSQILSGDKTVTRRMRGRRRPAVPGRLHKIKVDRTKNWYGWILIQDCKLERLGDLTDEEAVKEGFNNKEHYMNYFRHLNGDVDDDELIWRVEFEVIT